MTGVVCVSQAKELAEQAQSKAAEACEDFKPLEESEREAAREYFLAASRGNFLLEVFKSVNATRGDDFASTFATEATKPANCRT